jgi:hypothetical protein
MARAAIAILTPRARRANVLRWVEANGMREGIPYANIPIGTPIDTGTHPTCSADVLPIPCRTNRSGPTGLGSFPTPPDLRSGGTRCSLTLTVCAVVGYVRGGQRLRALECGNPTSVRASARVKETVRALECGNPTSVRASARVKETARARECGNLHQHSQRPRQRNNARTGMRTLRQPSARNERTTTRRVAT